MVTGLCSRRKIAFRAMFSTPLFGFNSRIQPNAITSGGTAIHEYIRAWTVTRAGRSVRSVSHAMINANVSASDTVPPAYQTVFRTRT